MFESLAVIGLWILTYCYLILASVDFGASFYLFYDQMIQGKADLALLINDYLSPVSEITNVCFVFFFATVLGFFPEMSYYYGTSLVVPGVIAVLLIVIKGLFTPLASF
ncbi:cytochrome d ubiquinol oxidase subunit II [Terrilactibacillus sp. S3-3]|nr:cytochrome d ubiquinol oxidase subunit II [Terrilactibacillus sp. S3-3]